MRKHAELMMGLLLTLTACGGGGGGSAPTPVPPAPVPVTIASPLSYVSPPQSATDIWTYERADFGDYQHVVAFVTDSTHATLVWSYTPFGPFVAANGDGGETYALDSTGAVYITATQDGSKPGVTEFGTGWWAFDAAVPNCAVGWEISPDGQGRACHMVITYPGSPAPITVDTVVSEHYANTGMTGPMERAFYGQGLGRLAWMAFDEPGCSPVDPARTPPISAFDTGPGPAKCDERLNTNIIAPAAGMSGNAFGWPAS